MPSRKYQQGRKFDCCDIHWPQRSTTPSMNGTVPSRQPPPPSAHTNPDTRTHKHVLLNLYVRSASTLLRHKLCQLNSNMRLKSCYASLLPMKFIMWMTVGAVRTNRQLSPSLRATMSNKLPNLIYSNGPGMADARQIYL